MCPAQLMHIVRVGFLAQVFELVSTSIGSFVHCFFVSCDFEQIQAMTDGGCQPFSFINLVIHRIGGRPFSSFVDHFGLAQDSMQNRIWRIEVGQYSFMAFPAFWSSSGAGERLRRQSWTDWSPVSAAVIPALAAARGGGGGGGGSGGLVES